MRSTGPPVTRCHRGIQVVGDAVGIDDGDEPVDQDGEIDDEDRVEDARVDEEPEQRDPVDADEHPDGEGESEDRPGREDQGPDRSAGIQLAQSGEEEREECCREGRPRAR